MCFNPCKMMGYCLRSSIGSDGYMLCDHYMKGMFVWLVAGGWCWFVLREKYCWLVAGGWFVLREKYCWLVADKPSEQAGTLCLSMLNGLCLCGCFIYICVYNMWS
jgi:hypothetical protein